MADDEASAYQGTTKYPTPPDAETRFPTQKAKAGGGLLSRIWKKVFRIRGDDFEKRLQHISKEEAAVLARLKRRTQDWRKISAHIIVFSVMLEVIAVGYAIMMTRSLDLNWKTRAFRVSPMFLLPVLSFVAYSALKNFLRMRDCKDHKTLESLRAERQEKIYELKEKTNYYITQQLIQMYDPDPAAKAAAATVLASKLGADSGLKVHVADESKSSVPKGMSSDMEVMESSGLRNRKQKLARSLSSGSTVLHHSNEETAICEGAPEQSQPLIVEHHREQESSVNDGGWVARIAALLVGEDPKQSFALICGNCRMHNGLAKEEDFPYITYYCPHCHALNRNKQMEEEPASVTNTHNEPFIPVNTSNEIGDCSCSLAEAAADIGSERIASVDSVG